MIEGMGVIHMLFAIWAIIHIAQSRTGMLGQILWIAAVLLFPLFGIIAFFLFGPRSVKNA